MEARTERRLEVLRAVVRAFVASGEPVGSGSIAGCLEHRVSPATVRNVMAELEEMGYLSQPHHSAGRVPTDRGYRAYVDELLGERRRRPEAPAEPTLGADVLHGVEGLDDVLAATSRALSRLSNCVGLVLHPGLSRTRFRHAHFLRLDGRRIVAVIIGENDVVYDQVVAVSEDYSQEELDRISNYVNNRFQGGTLLSVQEALERELNRERAACDAALSRWLRLALSCLERCVDSESVSVEGAAACVASRDFESMERVRELLRAYEQKDRIARLLHSCLEHQGVQIRIGSEECSGLAEEGLPGLSLVAVQYGAVGRPLGSVGVLGPTRMEYERIISVVDGVARDLSLALANGLPAGR